MQLVGLALASFFASTTALVSAQPAASNASLPLIPVPSNATQAASVRYTRCSMPTNSVPRWWYDSRSKGPYDMYGVPYNSWAMLNAYRRGGTENVHWKYTDDKFDPECLSYWAYYDTDGQRILNLIAGSATMFESTRLWCALPVYRSGGVQGKQWEWCQCWEEGSAKQP